MLQRILNAITGDYNQKQINKIMPLVREINHMYTQFESLSDDQIRDKVLEFRMRFTQGESLDALLPEVFAIVKQACKRLGGTSIEVKGQTLTRDMIPYDSQLIGGIILHQGKIAEMKTGEGKTLVASLPVILNAISGQGVHVVTVNDYLASRDAQWMGVLYEFLGLSVGCVTKGSPLETRRQEYEKDITYIENSELGFDYLRDHLVKSMQDRKLLRRPLNYAIVDEVDSILIDEARTPLIISQPDQEPTDKYVTYAQLVGKLKPCSTKKKVSKGFLKEILEGNEEKNIEDGDYYIDEKTKTVSLSSQGIATLEKMLGVENLYRDLGYQEIHHIENALRAQAVYHNEKDYIINNGEILIVDEHTGRTMPGRRYNEGLHQALEAKERVTIQREAKTLATITYQNFFKSYKKLAGMTGTATTEGEEFEKIYSLEVLAIPTNRKVIRVDSDDKVYFDQSTKWKFVTDYIKFYHTMGQPILIGTSSIYTSEYVSGLLKSMSITHTVLNAKYHEQEASIVAAAGNYGSVVVATNMAGRGTDIKLEKGLNQKLAGNYIKRAHQHLQDNPTQSVQLTVFSEKESELTLEAMKDRYELSDEEIRQSTNKRHSHAKIECKITYAKTQKTNQNPYAHITLRLKDQGKAEVVQKNLYYGLFILGTEKHESRRIDNQLRGRAGRQGDPGYSCFFVALDDEIMRKMGGERIQGIARMFLSKSDLNELELTQKQFTNSIIRAQKQMEARHFSTRKHLFEYDSVIDKQRQRIYKTRDQILHLTQDVNDALTVNELKSNTMVQEIEGFIKPVVDSIVLQAFSTQTDASSLVAQLSKEFAIQAPEDKIQEALTNKSLSVVMHQLFQSYFEDLLKAENPYRTLRNGIRAYLEAIDLLRVDHIDEMQNLRDKVGLYGYAQLDPLTIYKKEAFEKFEELMVQIKTQTLQRFFSSMSRTEEMIIQAPGGMNINFNNLQTQGGDESSLQIIDADSSSVAGSHHDKLRPNDTISVRYQDGRLVQTKYKKVKEDLESGLCVRVG